MDELLPAPATSRTRALTAAVGVLAAMVVFIMTAPAARAAWSDAAIAQASLPARDDGAVAVVVDSTGTATAVWPAPAADDGALAFSRRVGGTWSAPALIAGTEPASGSGNRAVQLVRLPNRDVLAVWLEVSASNVGTVRAVAFDAGSSAWGSSETVDTGIAPEGLALAADASGTAVAVWRTDDPRVRVARRVVTGGVAAWTDRAEYRSGGFARSPAVAVDASGNATVVWTDDHAASVPYGRWSAGAWSGTVDGSGGLTPARLPIGDGFKTHWWAGMAVAVDGSGSVTAVTTVCRDPGASDCGKSADPASRTADTRIAAFHRAAGDGSWTQTWATGAAVSGAGSYEGSGAALDVLSDGRVVAAWRGNADLSGTMTNTYAAIWNGTAWTAPHDLGTSEGQTTVGSYGAGAQVVWRSGGRIAIASYDGSAWGTGSTTAAGSQPRVAAKAGSTSELEMVIAYSRSQGGTPNTWAVRALDLMSYAPARVLIDPPVRHANRVEVRWDYTGGDPDARTYAVLVSDGAASGTCTVTAPTQTCDVTGVSSDGELTVTVTTTNVHGSSVTTGSFARPSGSMVVWSNCNGAGIGSARVNLSDERNLVTAASSARSGACPWGTAVDVAGDRLYWVDWTGGADPSDPSKIWVSELDGSNPQVLYTDGVGGVVIKSVNGLIVDTAQTPARIYWVNWELSIGYANLDGSGGAGELFRGASTPNSNLAVDSANGYLYWAEGSGAIRRGAIDGSGAVTTIVDDCATTVSETGAIVVDPDAGRIYRHAKRASDGVFVLQAMGVDGSGCVDIAATIPNRGWGLSWDARENRLFFDDDTGSTVRYVDLDAPSTVGTVVTASAVMDYVNFAVAISPPMPGTAAAVTADGSTPGATLSCSPATWLGDVVAMNANRAVRSVALSWTRDGVTIPGATAPTLVAATAGSYACVSSGTNVAGTTTSTSNAIAIAAAAAPEIAAPEASPAPDADRAAVAGPAQSVAATAPSAALRPSNRFRMQGDGPRQIGLTVISTIRVPGAGSLRQIGRFGRARRASVACSAQLAVRQAGVVVMRCTLSEAALRSAVRTARAGMVPLLLETTFIPSGGSARTASTRVNLRARDSAPSRVTG